MGKNLLFLRVKKVTLPFKKAKNTPTYVHPVPNKTIIINCKILSRHLLTRSHIQEYKQVMYESFSISELTFYGPQLLDHSELRNTRKENEFKIYAHKEKKQISRTPPLSPENSSISLNFFPVIRAIKVSSMASKWASFKIRKNSEAHAGKNTRNRSRKYSADTNVSATNT